MPRCALARLIVLARKLACRIGSVRARLPVLPRFVSAPFRFRNLPSFDPISS
jgi:hypothetical protein